MRKPIIIAVKGEIRVLEDLRQLKEALDAGEFNYVIIGEDTVILAKQEIAQTTIISQPEKSTGKKVGPRYINVVLDQMFKGFADILVRELDHVYAHEIMGVGLTEPVSTGRVKRWPAKDDYDVMKIVEAVSREGPTIFFTGDKKLARQIATLGLKQVRVEYMPPNEYPGKETIVRVMLDKIKSMRELLSRT
jgi:hypothetical protein